ncbi:MAG: hypothetical protein ACREBS_07890 [Nitrososphaerales archaeon]
MTVDSMGRRNRMAIVEPELISPFVKDLVSTLQNFGYSSEVSGQLRGISGTAHKFDIVSKREGYTIVMEMLPTLNQESIALKILELRVKSWDCSPDLVVIVSASHLNDTGMLKEFGSLYNLAVVEGIDQEEIRGKLEDALASLDEEQSIAKQ